MARRKTYTRRKGRCKKWSKGRKRCLKRLKPTSRRYKGKRRSRRVKRKSLVSKCMNRGRRGARTRKVCLRLSRNKCLTKKGTLKKKKICRSIARARGLRRKTFRRRRKRSALSSRGNYFGRAYREWGDLIQP